MPKAAKDHISRAIGDAGAAPAAPGQAVRRGGLARFSNKDWAVLLTALAVAVVGTTAAALSPGRPIAATSNASKMASATAHASQATAGVEATALGSSTETSSSVATTGSAAATSPVATSGTIAAKKVATVATVKASTPVPALVTIGTIVNFGTYGNAPLQWRVLYADADELLLLSRYVVSAGAFQSDWEGRHASSYGASEVRTWLLGDFASAAFTTQEKAALLPHTGAAAGTDRVFLLSAAEVQRYLPKAKDRKAAPHAVARAGQVGFSGEPLSLSGVYASWWLADAAGDDFAARVVKPSGKLGSQLVYYADLGVRPAIRVNRAKVAFTLDTRGGG